jgi:hypothetical protein
MSDVIRIYLSVVWVRMFNGRHMLRVSDRVLACGSAYSRPESSQDAFYMEAYKRNVVSCPSVARQSPPTLERRTNVASYHAFSLHFSLRDLDRGPPRPRAYLALAHPLRGICVARPDLGSFHLRQDF